MAGAPGAARPRATDEPARQRPAPGDFASVDPEGKRADHSCAVSQSQRAGPPAPPEECEHDGEGCNKNWNQSDIHKGKKCTQRVDILPQAVLDVAQFTARGADLASEPGDFALLILGERGAGLCGATLLQRVEPALGIGQALLERVCFLLESGLRLSLQFPNDSEGATAGCARAQGNQVIGPRKILDRIDDEGRVVREWRCKATAVERFDVNPEAVVENIAVRHDNDVDRSLRQLELVRSLL